MYVAVGPDHCVDISSSITIVSNWASLLLFTPESQDNMFPFPHSSSWFQRQAVKQGAAFLCCYSDVCSRFSSPTKGSQVQVSVTLCNVTPGICSEGFLSGRKAFSQQRWNFIAECWDAVVFKKSIFTP